MLRVIAIEDKAEQAALCAAYGLTYRARAFCYAVYENDSLAGICQFTINGGCGTVHDLLRTPQSTDPDALFLMARQALNFIDLCGTHAAVFEGDCEDALLRKIGFSKYTRNIWNVDLHDFFSSPCKHN